MMVKTYRVILLLVMAVLMAIATGSAEADKPSGDLDNNWDLCEVTPGIPTHPEGWRL